MTNEDGAMVKWWWKGKTGVTGGKEKLDSVPLCLPQMTKASRDLICHTREDGRHCLRRKGTKICGGVCGYCQPNCQHSRITVNERTSCIHQLCLRTSHVEHPVYISCASEHVSCWTPCIHEMRLKTCLMLNRESNVQIGLYEHCIPRTAWLWRQPYV